MDLNKDAIRKWVEALRSGKYQQTTGRLADRNGFCCLGVACEVAIENGLRLRKKESGDSVGTVEYNDCAGELPDEVADWLGLYTEGDDEEAFHHLTDPPLHTADHPKHSAVSWNDEENATFSQIADLIESAYLDRGEAREKGLAK
jgi:hypothetical protein